MRVVYWNSIASPYAVERLAAFGALHDVDLTVLFDTLTEPGRGWAVPDGFPFRTEVLGERAHRAGRARRVIDGIAPDVLVSLWHTAPQVSVLTDPRLRAHRTMLRVLPTFESWNRRTLVRESTKRVVFASADAAKVPGPDGRRYAGRYGLPAARCFDVTQSVERVHRTLPPRRTSSAPPTRFLHVGRLMREKGVLDLVDAWERAALGPAHLTLVGDGDLRDELSERAHRPGSRLSVEPFVQPAELAELYRRHEVLVFPTLGDPHGLVFDEAHCAGLHVITSTAAGDMVRRAARTGSTTVYPAGDVETLAVVLTRVAGTPLAALVDPASAELARSRTPERYAADLLDACERTLALEPRNRLRRAGRRGGRAS